MTERETGLKFIARMGANESTFGPAPSVKTAIANAANDAFKYADPEAFDLKNALGKHWNIPTENMIVGEGIDGLMGLLCRLMLAPGDIVVTSAGAYPTFNYQVAGAGGVLETVPYKDDFEDPDALITRAREMDAKMVYLANPDNPMGTWHTADVVQKMIDNCPVGCLLVLDEAYFEMAPDGIAPPVDVANKNVIRFRTFSKAYGLAGARVGYGIAHVELIKAFDKIRNHFGVNIIGQQAALAALKDQEYVKQIQSAVAAGRDRVVQIAQENGLSTVKSATNFVAVDCGKNGDFTRKVLAELLDQGIFVRMAFVPPQDRCLRVSIGIPEDIERFAQALPIALAAARAN
jgi:histidinol-phosphate aminotransferase